MHRAEQALPAAGPAAKPSRPSIDGRAKTSPSLHRSTSTTAIHSTSFAARRSRAKHLRSHASCDSLPDMISPEEYAALPASIQRKYFSSKERLCIAQQSAVQSRQKQHGKLGSWLSSTSTSDLRSTRPSASEGLHSLKPKSRSHDPKLFLVRFAEDSISAEEARWFLSLPEKVRTKRFSREELVTLTARCHRVLAGGLPETDRDPAQRRRSVHRLEASACVPIGTALSSPESSVRTSTTEAPSADSGQLKEEQAEGNKPRRIPTDVVDISKTKNGLHDELPAETDQAVETAVDPQDAEMEILKLYLRRRSLKAKASTSNVKRPPPGSPPTAPSQPAKRRTFRRLHMLTPLPLPPPVLAPAPRPQTITPFSTSARLSRPFLDTDRFSSDSGARPGSAPAELCDTAAPQVQVEGEVFELPANEEPTFTVTTDEDCPYPHLVFAFSDDDTEEGGKDHDDSESVETVGPRTPSPMQHDDTAIEESTSDSSTELPMMHLDARPKTPSTLDRNSTTLSNYSSPHHSFAMRELRTSSEEILYAYQRRLTSGVDVDTADPLALVALPICDDETGAHGAFAARDSSSLAPTKGLRKVFKSLRHL